MKKMLFIFLLTLASTFSFAGESTFRLLPSNSTQGEAFFLGGDDEVERISQKMAQAIARDQAWLQSYLATLDLKPGELLPYHPRLGITKPEHEYIASRIGKLKLVSLGNATINIERFQGKEKVLISGDRLRLNFLVDPIRNTITTNRGEMFDRTVIDADESSPLGAWNGEQWARSDERTRFREKIAIGKVADGSMAIIYYDIISPEEGVVSHFIIRYRI